MVNGLGFLDDLHLPFGSHQQKIIVLHTGTELIAYVGGLELNDDRTLPVAKGAPLFDVSVRIAGSGAQAVLKTFVDRWNNHPDGASVGRVVGRRTAPGGLAVGPDPLAGSVPVRPPIVHPVWLDLYWNTIADPA